MKLNREQNISVKCGFIILIVKRSDLNSKPDISVYFKPLPATLFQLLEAPKSSLA